MNRMLTTLGAVGMGAGLMYFLDSERGRRRRKLLRDRAVRLLNETEHFLETASRDLRQRTRGIVAEVKKAMFRSSPSDNVLVERVRAKIGRYVSRPRTIHVLAENGRLLLSGPILASEVQPFVTAVAKVPGVKSVENYLDAQDGHHFPVPSTNKPPMGERLDILQRNWSPATRMIVGAAGTILVLYGVTRRTPIASSWSAAGLGMLFCAGRGVQ